MKRIIDEIDQMTLAEKRELAEQVRIAIARDLESSKGDPDRCPHYGCPRFTKKGHSANGHQRWLCAGCARTFSASSLSLIGRSKLPPEAWMEFAECMAYALPLRETARRVEVSLYTAWFMRMRVCEVMGRHLLPVRGETFEVDGTYFNQSLPGNHSKSWHDLNRPAHRTGHDGKGRGSKVCVVCGISETGDCFCELGDSYEGLTESTIVSSMLPEKSSLITDGRACYRDVSGHEHVVRDSKELNMVNTLHSRLKAFIRRFNGVSNRRLQRYLDWFCWREQFRRSDKDHRKLLYDQEITGIYSCTRAVVHLETWPYMPAFNRWTIGRGYGYMTLSL